MTEPRQEKAPGPWRDRRDRYGRISIILHWATATLVLALIALGLLMDWTIGFDDQWLYAQIKFAHVSAGVVLVVLVVPRVAWRLVSGWPAPLPQPQPLQFLAGLVPRLLLVGIVIQAVTGVFARWTARAWPGYDAQSLPLFGLFEVPSPFANYLPDWHRILEQVHDVTADCLLILVAVHILGALKHYFQDGGRRGLRQTASIL